MHYPTPSLEYLIVRGCTDVNHGPRQYREGHLVVGPTKTKPQEFRFRHDISLKGGSYVQAVVWPGFVQVRDDDQRAYG